MPRKTVRLRESFESHVSTLERTRIKMEELFARNEISVEDINQVYSGLFLSLFTEFEILLEKLFLGLLDGSYSSCLTDLPNPCRKMKVNPCAEFKAVVFAGKSYLDWLPYKDHTLKRAKRFFVHGEPFCRLSSSQIGNLKEYHMIRNAIAHKSEFAQQKFQDLISGFTLLPYEKQPPGYLRSKPSGSQTQFELIVAELKFMVRVLCG